jgi:divalent metal cation (Fe/Co/Zn/Cd) transporter
MERRLSHKFRIETHSPGSLHATMHEFEVADGSPPGDRSHLRVPHARSYGTGASDLCDEDTLQAILNERAAESEEVGDKVSFIINLSLAVNLILFVGKCVAYWASGSMSIAASVVDSFLDLLVQLIIYLSNSGMRSRSEQDKRDYPAGKSRFEPVGLIACAALMFIAALELISRSFFALYDGVTGAGTPDVPIDALTVLLLVFVIISKAALWLYCHLRTNLSSTVETLAFDHRNDVLSNIAAAAAILFYRLSHKLWWADALGCILISLYIANNWYELAMEKVHELVGRYVQSILPQ